MGLKSMLKIEYKGMFLFAIFYLIAGIANLLILGMHNFRLLHVTLVAFLSLITAFGLYRMRSWSLWLVTGLFFITTTYSALMLNAYSTNYATNPDITNLLAILTWAAYLILTWIATTYILAKRKNLR
jgi:hypothetical protein